MRRRSSRRAARVETEDGYAVVLDSSDVGEPKLLTASLARSMGRLVLFEADEEVDPRVEGALSSSPRSRAGSASSC